MILPVMSAGGGTCFAIPDVCKTPAAPSPIPIPYPNTAMMTQAKGSSCAAKVKIENKKVILKKSEISMSSGDEAGSLGGMVSSKFKGPVTFKKGNSKVKAHGSPVVYLTCMTGHNGKNANMPAGAVIAPGQTKVKVTP